MPNVNKNHNRIGNIRRLGAALTAATLAAVSFVGCETVWTTTTTTKDGATRVEAVDPGCHLLAAPQPTVEVSGAGYSVKYVASNTCDSTVDSQRFWLKVYTASDVNGPWTLADSKDPQRNTPGMITAHVDATSNLSGPTYFKTDLYSEAHRSSHTYTSTMIWTTKVGPYWASWKYGGLDHHINGPAERAAVIAALSRYEANNQGNEYGSVFKGMDPTDKAALAASGDGFVDDEDTVVTGVDLGTVTHVPTQADFDDIATNPGGASAATFSTAICASGSHQTSNGAGSSKTHQKHSWGSNGYKIYTIQLKGWVVNCSGNHSRSRYDLYLDTTGGPEVDYRLMTVRGDGSIVNHTVGYETYPADEEVPATRDWRTLPTDYYTNGGKRPKSQKVVNSASASQGNSTIPSTYTATMKY